jgi:iron complex outermembrane receptor protein
VRGFSRPGDYNSRMLVLVDGHRLNDNIFDQALLGTEGVVDVDLIDHLEVIRGPSSSIYGDSAFFGVVNITTRRGGQINGVEASVEAGSYDTYKGRFTYGQKFTNDVKLLLSGSWYESAGQSQLYYPEFDSPAIHYGIAHDADGDLSQSALASLAWKDFTLSGAFSNREKQVPTASFGTVFDAGLEKTTDLRAYLDLKFQHDFSEDTRLMARVSYDLYSYHGLYPYYSTNFTLPMDPVQIVVNHDDALGEWVGTEWQLTQKLFEKHTLIAGVDYRENLEQLQNNYYDEPGFDNVRIDRSTGYNVGVYGQALLSGC